MSSEPIICVRNLGKKYRVNQSSMGHYRRLLEDIAFWYKKKPLSKKAENEFWALQNLNFSINAGESVGIIGANGSGKSTLLKILSRVTWPTTGSVEILGKVSALLEVGTGFHLELSGRENVFLSGAMLGMNKAEVTKHFDEIVAFSGVEKFLDTAVKKYSSGMFLRLAFAVMAHLDSDVLIVDEILAVGDAQFQAQCLDKMSSIIKEGKTVLFVSHQIEKIEAFCKKTIWLKEGQLFDSGATDEVLSRYQNSSAELLQTF